MEFELFFMVNKKNYTILHSISEIIRKNKFEGADSLANLADRSINKCGWSVDLLEAYDGRKKPMFTSELITHINAANQQEFSQVNSARTKLINRLETEISTKRKIQNDRLPACRRQGW